MLFHTMPDDDIFECIRCGKRVYHAANYCPHCGLELYPEPEEADEATPAARAGQRGGRAARWRGLALLVLLALLYPALAPFVSAPVLLLLLGGIALALVGGLVYRRLRQRARDRATLRRILEQFEAR